MFRGQLTAHRTGLLLWTGFGMQEMEQAKGMETELDEAIRGWEMEQMVWMDG